MDPRLLAVAAQAAAGEVIPAPKPHLDPTRPGKAKAPVVDMKVGTWEGVAIVEKTPHERAEEYNRQVFGDFPVGFKIDVDAIRGEFAKLLPEADKTDVYFTSNNHLVFYARWGDRDCSIRFPVPPVQDRVKLTVIAAVTRLRQWCEGQKRKRGDTAQESYQKEARVDDHAAAGQIARTLHGRFPELSLVVPVQFVGNNLDIQARRPGGGEFIVTVPSYRGPYGWTARQISSTVECAAKVLAETLSRMAEAAKPKIIPDDTALTQISVKLKAMYPEIAGLSVVPEGAILDLRATLHNGAGVNITVPSCRSADGWDEGGIADTVHVASDKMTRALTNRKLGGPLPMAAIGVFSPEQKEAFANELLRAAVEKSQVARLMEPVRKQMAVAERKRLDPAMPGRDYSFWLGR